MVEVTTQIETPIALDVIDSYTITGLGLMFMVDTRQTDKPISVGTLVHIEGQTWRVNGIECVRRLTDPPTTDPVVGLIVSDTDNQTGESTTLGG